MLTKNVIVLLVLLVMVNRSLSLSCSPCHDVDCSTRTPSNCIYGVAKSPCSCGCYDRCARGPGETCGGIWGFSGTCSEGFRCNESYGEGICVHLLQSDILIQCLFWESGGGKNCEDPASCSCEDLVAKGVCTDTNLRNICKLSCGLCGDWKWILETDACIIGENNAVLDGISLDDCKVSCQDQSEFACRSLEYHFNSRRCILSEATSNSSNYRQPCPYKGGWIYTEV